MATGVALNHSQILEMLPHRDPILLLDEVTELVQGEKIKATFYVNENMDIFRGHFPNDPIFPGVYAVESATQATSLMVISMEKYKNKTPIFMGINHVSFKSKILPGDNLMIEGKLIKHIEERAIAICKARIFTERGLAMEEETVIAVR